MTHHLLVKLERLLQNHTDRILWWQWMAVARESVQRLYEKNEQGLLSPHQKRRVQETSYALELMTIEPGTDKVGLAQMDVDVWIPLEEQVQAALDMASHNLNPAWKPLLPPAQGYADVATADAAILQNASAVLNAIESDMLQEIATFKNIKVTTAEIYVRKSRVQRKTSTGIHTMKDRSDIYAELSMEKHPDHKDQEVNNVATAVSADTLHMKDFLQRCAQETLSLGHTEEPQTSEAAVILIDKEAISSLLAALRSQLSCALEYDGWPHLKIGDVLASQPKGDVLSLRLDPYCPGMVDSSPYTAEGVVTQAADVVVNGCVAERMVDNRFGQYLKLKPNGVMGNMLVPPGSTPVNDLRKKCPGVLEILTFSSLLVDDTKLTWSSEIKLAKRYNSDGSFVWIKGGVVSGHIRENLSECYFSKETDVVNFPGSGFTSGKGYQGPAYMLICKGVTVVGKRGV